MNNDLEHPDITKMIKDGYLHNEKQTDNADETEEEWEGYEYEIRYT